MTKRRHSPAAHAEGRRRINPGGAGWIVESKQPDVLRTLYMDFKAGIDDYFPDVVEHLTDHEIRELEARDLWFDWTEPPRPGAFGPEPDAEDGDDKPAGRRRKGRSSTSPTVSTAAQALEAIKNSAAHNPRPCTCPEEPRCPSEPSLAESESSPCRVYSSTLGGA
ncbi:hypothetical protein [Streptomyces sp. NPDC059122]|uniref:hypothetical protein n=1 Tax=Streptomyces sp. NPDC059122 TaxID=3346732 RepID=UPI0036B4DF34